MVGFPGETDAEFEESRQFIENLPLTYLHVFTYSERPGTPAAQSLDQVPMAVRKRRNQVLRDLGALKNLQFREKMLGSTLSVVTLENGSLSDNFLKVELATPRPANLLANIEIGALTQQGLRERSPFVVL